MTMHAIRYLGLKRASATSTHMRWVANFQCVESGEKMHAIIYIQLDKLLSPIPSARIAEQVTDVQAMLTAWCGTEHVGVADGVRGLSQMLDREMAHLAGWR